MKPRETTKEYTLSYDNFESAIVTFLYSVGAIPKDQDVIGSDFGVEVDSDGMITFDLTTVKHKPIPRPFHPIQMELPFEG